MASSISGGAGITADDLGLDAEGFFEQPGNVMAGAAGAGAAAFLRLFGIAQVVDSFKYCVGAHVVDDVVFFRRADPVEFRPIEFHFRAPDQLIEIERRIDRAER